MPRQRQPLPPTSLPLRFHLLPSQSTRLSSPVACVSAKLPLRPHPAAAAAAASTSTVKVEDLTSGAARAGIEVYRIIDPEHQETFVSLARVFAALSISPLEGIIMFDLKSPTYDATLAGIAPFNDLWVPLKVAREVADALDVLDELAGLLEWESRGAYSVEDKEEGGVVHNWKISTDTIDPESYSTEAMLSTSFSRIYLLPTGNQVRTLISPPATKPESPSTFLTTFESLYAHVVDWTILEWESYVDRDDDADDDSPSSSSSAASRSQSPNTNPSLPPTFNYENGVDNFNPTLSSLYTTLISLSTLNQTLPPSALPSTETLGSTLIIGSPLAQFSTHLFTPPITSDLSLPPPTHAPPLQITRQELLHPSSSSSGLSKGPLGLVHILGLLVINEWKRRLEEENVVKAAAPRKRRPMAQMRKAVLEKSGVMAMEKRLEALEREVARSRSGEIGEVVVDEESDLPSAATRGTEAGEETREEAAELRTQVDELMAAQKELKAQLGVLVELVGSGGSLKGGAGVKEVWGVSEAIIVVLGGSLAWLLWERWTS
ncbi:hypothetical protein MNV49_006468 [Pseudohyphozyma bogoriensis]|nr:hypothetical protein MNV49_006468 [Pseudohyphozyma bogoriensis]